MEKYFFTVAYLRMSYQMLQFRLFRTENSGQESNHLDPVLEDRE
jgi:hypothetical protein